MSADRYFGGWGQWGHRRLRVLWLKPRFLSPRAPRSPR